MRIINLKMQTGSNLKNYSQNKRTVSIGFQKGKFLMSIKVGQPAPDFTLKSHLDTEITLSDFRGQRNIVIAFFPLAWTPV
jgi:peroxiredoxin